MSNGTSLARKYGQKGSPRGNDLVPNGNGYVRSLKEKEGGQAVYYFTEVNEDEKGKEHRHHRHHKSSESSTEDKD